MSDRPRESCGLFGAYDFEGRPVATTLYWGMISQNHRGHQSYGFLTSDGEFRIHTGLGLIPNGSGAPVREIQRLSGHRGVGHVRYATSGEMGDKRLSEAVQPYIDEYKGFKIGIGHNGNIVNQVQLSKRLKKKFGTLSSSTDTELLAKKLLEGLEEGGLPAAVETCMTDVEGSFSVVGLNNEGKLFAFRDPLGIKPLCFGSDEEERIHAVSSESVGLNINGFQVKSQVNPGELLEWSEDGFTRHQIVKRKEQAFCSFEYAYFARPDSFLDGRPVYRVREEFGRNFGREYPDVVERADIIVSIPQTANDAAYGFHVETGLSWERATRRHRYVTSRAFISSPRERDTIINKKINIDSSRIKGKRVAAVDDSIVRGSTSKRMVRKLKEAGAEEVHLFITFPRIVSPCFYGIDMATYGELIGSDRSPEEIAEVIGADSVNYQSLEGFIDATGMRKDELCLGCITGRYPTRLAQELADKMREKHENGHEETGRIYESNELLKHVD